MAQAVRSTDTKPVKCFPCDISHLYLAKLREIVQDLFIMGRTLHCGQPLGQWRLWAVAKLTVYGACNTQYSLWMTGSRL